MWKERKRCTRFFLDGRRGRDGLEGGEGEVFCFELERDVNKDEVCVTGPLRRDPTGVIVVCEVETGDRTSVLVVVLRRRCRGSTAAASCSTQPHRPGTP